MVLEDRADGAGPGPWASGFVYAEPVSPAVVANNHVQINDEIVEKPEIPRAHSAHTTGSLGNAPGRFMKPAETVEVMKFGPPLLPFYRPG